MTVGELKKKSKKEVMEFIGRRLSLPYTNRKRFDMSGYEYQTGKSTLWNLSILNEFADLGIYDYTHYLFLDFYKGCGNLYLRYFNTYQNIEIELGGYGTREIIYKIFELTIFSSREQRRRTEYVGDRDRC